MDIQFYWINGRIVQGQFRVFWRPGPENLGDYHSKHHSHEHHIAVQIQIFTCAYTQLAASVY